jgi:tRNA modification GTPase
VIMVIDATENALEDSEDDRHASTPQQLFAEWIDKFPEGVGITILKNKIDLLKSQEKLNGQESTFPFASASIINVSAKTGEGLETFKTHLKNAVGFSKTSEGDFFARRRHVEALMEARQTLKEASIQLETYGALELVAEELRQTQKSLDLITGKFTSDDLLGKIFSEFCIGK